MCILVPDFHSPFPGPLPPVRSPFCVLYRHCWSFCVRGSSSAFWVWLVWERSDLGNSEACPFPPLPTIADPIEPWPVFWQGGGGVLQCPFPASYPHLARFRTLNRLPFLDP